MGLWDAKPRDGSWAPPDCHPAGKEPAARQDGESHPGITWLPAGWQGLGETGLGLEVEPRQLVRIASS